MNDVDKNVSPGGASAASLVAEPEMSQFMKDAIAERRRQVTVEGWTPEHDDEHDTGSMASAAACYALHTEPVGNIGDYLRFWPWASKWWKPKDRRSNLVRATALCLAEGERIDRKERCAAERRATFRFCSNCDEREACYSEGCRNV